MNLLEAKRIVEREGYDVVRNSGCHEKKIARLLEAKRVAERAGYRVTKRREMNERFGESDGTTFTSICEKYIANSTFLILAAKSGLKDAVEQVLADVEKSIGSGISDAYYKKFAARLRAAKSSVVAMSIISNAMLAGEGMDNAAGTSASAYNRRMRERAR